MENINSKYEQMILERERVVERLAELESDETIKEYHRLHKENERLSSELMDLYPRIKEKKYSSCNHIWVNTLHQEDNYEGRAYNYYGCVKCGLDRRVFHQMRTLYNPDRLGFEQRIMYDYMRNNAMTGLKTDIFCDLDLGKAIYAKIKEVHPDISDEMATVYLQVALHYIREIEVSEERKKDRAKRLLLQPSFNKWTAGDVCK